MKHLSLLKLAAALFIGCVYIFVCGVTGTVVDDKKAAADAVLPPDDEKPQGAGTMDFILPDDIEKAPELSQSVESLSFGTPSISMGAVYTEFKPSELVSGAASENGSDVSDNGTDITEADIQIVDPYVPPASSSSTSYSSYSSSSSSYSPPSSSYSSSESGSSYSSESSSSSSYSSSSSSSSQSSSSSEPEAPAEPHYPGAADEILTVNDNGTVVTGNALDIISRITTNEIGGSFAPEAIKAQAVAAYTYVRYFNDRGQTPSVILSNNVSDSTRVLISSVIGQAVYYNGDIIQAVYSASSAGATASSVNVWGSDLPYLRSVYCELDAEYDPNYGRTKTFSSSDIRSRVYNITGIYLDGDPENWLEIENRVEGKYVGSMSVGGYHSYTNSYGDSVTINGRVFRERIMDFDIRSSAFDISYDASTDEFTFTTYGYGHGVGLSQNGANNLAVYWGWDYKQILEFYYQGAYVG